MSSGDDLRRLAAGVLLGSFHGPVVPEWLARWVDGGLGGVCLFGSNLTGAATGVEAAAAVAGALHAASPRVVVALDEEGGDVTRLEARTGSSLPGNAALGIADDVVLTRDVLGALGAVLRSAGIDLDLAPCADVNVDAANPVIGVRSFGADPELVARHVAAAVQGLQDAGVAACAKHFPGHGATTVDSHLDLPVVAAPADLVRRRELVPFRAAVAAGAATIMTGHLLLPAFDGDRPATLSRRLLGDVLRGELGFTGAVVTDALDMHGVGGPPAIPANVVRAVVAGADLCCLGSDATDELTGACIDAVVAAVQDGTLDESRLAEAAANVSAIAASTDPAARDADLVRLGREAAERAIVVEGAPPGPLRGAHVVEMKRPPTIAAGEVPASLSQAMLQLDPTVTSDVLGTPPPPPADGPLVVVVRDPQVVPGAPEKLAALLAARPDAVVVDLGWPAPGSDARGRTRIGTFGASRVSIEAVARLLTVEPLTAGRSGRG
jgi:beta-N-acetylhexosaminidase